MNQSILFNDDHYYDISKGAWCFTGILAGEIVNIRIISAHSENSALLESTKLDWEMLVEDWLDDNEPIDGVLSLTY